MTDPSVPGLLSTLREINRARAAGAAASGSLRSSRAEREIEEAHAPSRRLAVYGSLAPGGSNHGVVAPLGGRWTGGRVRGHLHEPGWGAGVGYPGLVWDPGGAEVAVQVLESEALALDWERIDAFEGPDYVRILVPVELDGGGELVANLYAMRP